MYPDHLLLCSYEGGRLVQQGDGLTQCGIKIKNVTVADNGTWECIIGTLRDGFAVPKYSFIEVVVAGTWSNRGSSTIIY